MKMPIIYYDHPILRKKAEKVLEITDEIKQLIQDMIDTMDSTGNGVAIAANQVGKLLRIFVLRPEVKGLDGEFMLGAAEVYINPILSNPDKEKVIVCEGCLSFPGLHFDVCRPKSICVEATNLKGERFKEVVAGFKAREVMHENDHLNGTLILDYAPAGQREKLRKKMVNSKEIG